MTAWPTTVEGGVTIRETRVSQASAPPDLESAGWLRALRGEGAAAEDARARLHALLLRAARFEVARRKGSSGLGREELDELANEAADDALLAVLRKLDEFRGLSRFTTWAYKFALYEAAVKVRRRSWHSREVPLPEESWQAFASRELEPDADAELRERFAAVRAAIAEALTPHQRRVLLAIVVEGVPIDVLAERLTTTRGALYKTLHDARAKLREHLEDEL